MNFAFTRRIPKFFINVRASIEETARSEMDTFTLKQLGQAQGPITKFVEWKNDLTDRERKFG